MSQASISAPRFKLEGEFSSYSLKWSVVVGRAFDVITENFSVFGDYVFVSDLSNLTNDVRNLSDGSLVDAKTWRVPTLFPRMTRELHSSAGARYVARSISENSGSNTGKFEVWKDGALLQTITVSAGNRLGDLEISYDGKYILASVETTDCIYLYEGS